LTLPETASLFKFRAVTFRPSPLAESLIDTAHWLVVPNQHVPLRVFRFGLALVVVAFHITLTPLAYATPPDPTWQLSLFDDDDFDDVVGYITSAAALAEAPVERCLRFAPVLVVLRCSSAEDPAPFVPLSSADPRAPPAPLSV